MKFLSNVKKIHCIGIGGIAVSAMAKYARHHGITVTGSDLVASRVTNDLSEHYDIPVYIGVRAENITPEHDLVIYSPAVPENNIERAEARNLGIVAMSYPQVLGKLSEEYTTIAVSGTNGKTTTTTMVVELLKHLGVDPTGIVGEYLQLYNSNFVAGQSEYLVTEACEFKDSFLHIHHDIAVITNITEDHLDYFGDLEHIQQSFISFLDNTKGTGVLVCNTELPELAPVIGHAKKISMRIIPYQIHNTSDLVLTVPGEHNRENAAAALGVIEALNLSDSEAITYLNTSFQGAKRRMEHVGMTHGGSLLFDDYAHNPEGLEHLITGLRDVYPDKKIVMLFEPHLYSRTRDFKEGFGRELSRVDVLYLFPTYRARDERIPSEDYLLEQYIDTSAVELIPVHDIDNFPKLFEERQHDYGDIVITVGAGDIWKQGLRIKKQVTHSS